MSQVKKLTRLGSDTRKIAALLQAKAPKGEMLAYISPQEAALLKARGGSGKPHADTGIPSYQNEWDDAMGFTSTETTPMPFLMRTRAGTRASGSSISSPLISTHFLGSLA